MKEFRHIRELLEFVSKLKNKPIEDCFPVYISLQEDYLLLGLTMNKGGPNNQHIAAICQTGSHNDRDFDTQFPPLLYLDMLRSGLHLIDPMDERVDKFNKDLDEVLDEKNTTSN